MRLDVHGHLVADDIFGDGYVIPMTDILADIQRSFGADAIDLPTGLDILSMDRLQQSGLFCRPRSRHEPQSEFPTRRLDDPSHLSNTRDTSAGSMTSAALVQRPLPTLPSVDVLRLAVETHQTATNMVHPGPIERPRHADSVNSNHPVNVPRPYVTPDSGYSSLYATPSPSPPPQIVSARLQYGSMSKNGDKRLLKAFEAAGRCGMFDPYSHCELSRIHDSRS